MTRGPGERPPPGSDPRGELASAETELPAEPTPASDRAAGGAAEEDGGARAVRTRAIGPGDELGRYAVGEELGAGGMATVFRARDRELRRDVAIKVLFPHLARKADVTRRFQREARAAAGLEHPNILRVYDVGGAVGDLPPFIVMELVRGGTLRELIPRASREEWGRERSELRGSAHDEAAERAKRASRPEENEIEGEALPAEVVACVGALVCEALAVAHAAGIVHRDVKPGNVMFADDGRLLLADFGVAHLDDDDSLVTRTGALLGTPSFMAPEQALGNAVDARSDLYAVGATLYQLATGSMPYSGPTAKIVTEASKGSAPPAVRRRPAIGSELSRLIGRLMEPDPAKRPATAAVAARELAAVAAAGGVDDPAAELRALAADRAGHVAARTPALVTRLVERAEHARARRSMAQAISLCDRALAMAPEDPRVQALEAGLAAGGGRRWIVVGVATLAVAGLASGAWMMTRSRSRAVTSPADAAVAVVVGDDAGVTIGLDASTVVAIPDDAATAMTSVTRLDGGRARLDAGHAPMTLDAAVVAVDAAPPAPPIDAAVAPLIDAAPAPVAVTFSFDTWCDLAVDGIAHGRPNRAATVPLTPGSHAAACRQGPGLGSWARTIDVVAGRANRFDGELLPRVDVVAGVGDQVRIDGVTVPRGSSLAVKLGPHVVEVMVGGKVTRTARVSIVGRCTLRDQPSLDCYP